MTPEEQIARLERRLERERRARRDSEQLAERGMRDLFLANKHLDERVNERTKDLEEINDQLQLAVSARARFLATLSHEMRTPLNGVLGMLELVGTYLDDPQPVRYLATARESADRLHQLLARLFDLVELDSGDFKAEPRPVEASHLADVMRRRWSRPMLQSGQLLTVSSFIEADMLEVDESRVHQIVDELLHNVASHGSPGAVRVEIELDGQQLVITVIDAGPGIEPDRIEALFDDFAMLDDTTARAAQGLGLGLGLCRRIVHALDGSLELTSDGASSLTAVLKVSAVAWNVE